MTSDLEATTDDIYTAIRGLWQEAQGGSSDELAPPAGFGQSVASVPDVDIASATGLELDVIREYLDNADGTSLVVGRDGETRAVKALL